MARARALMIAIRGRVIAARGTLHFVWGTLRFNVRERWRDWRRRPTLLESLNREWARRQWLHPK
jgi:hypothetical protein